RAQPARRAGAPPGVADHQPGHAPRADRRGRPHHRLRHRRGAAARDLGALPGHHERGRAMRASSAVSELAVAEVEQFLYREARLADEHDYDGWEALWTDDGVYWIPGGGRSDVDPDTQMSIAYDNRSRIGLRVAQLKSGKRHSQTPPSSVRRMISNVELMGTEG